MTVFGLFVDFFGGGLEDCGALEVVGSGWNVEEDGFGVGISGWSVREGGFVVGTSG